MKNRFQGLYLKAGFMFNNGSVSAKKKLNTKRKGAFAFEYIIILVLMVFIIYTAWSILQPKILQKVNNIGSFIDNNGV